MNLTDRIKSYEAKIAKMNETLAKKTASIEKFKEKFSKKADKASEADIREYNFNLSLKEDDLRDLGIRISEAEKRLGKLREEAEAKKKSAFEIPECFNGFLNDLVENWDMHDKKKRDEIRSLGRNYYLIRESEGKIPSIDNAKKSEYYRWYDLTDEQIHKDNVRTAEALVRNLVIRCREKAGEIESFSGLKIARGNMFKDGGMAINGFVQGSKGSAYVHSVFAGGWNIQRLHVRVLVD